MREGNSWQELRSEHILKKKNQRIETTLFRNSIVKGKGNGTESTKKLSVLRKAYEYFLDWKDLNIYLGREYINQYLIDSKYLRKGDFFDSGFFLLYT